jgi:hypothetical protein
MMRRIMLLGTLALVAAAMILASALPTFAKQVKTQVGGQQVGEEGTCTVLPGTTYPTIQSAVDDPSCQTIQLESGFYTETGTIIDRDLTIIGGSPEEPSHVGHVAGSPIFTILTGTTVTLEDLHIEGATGEFDGAGIHNQGTLILNRVAVHDNGALNGGGIYNEGTLTLSEGSSVYSNLAVNNGGGIYNAGAGTVTLNEGSSVHSNVAHEDGGGIYNEGTLFLCGGTVTGNQAPRLTVNNISGNAAQECPAAPPPGGPGPGEKGGMVLVDHKGKELCLPEAALNGHLNHGDEVIDEEGCSPTTPSPAAAAGA